MTKKAYFVGIDCGTTVVKSVLFDLEGTEVATAAQEVPVTHPCPGWADQCMNKVWEAAKNTIRGIINRAGVSGEDIKGVSLSGQGAGVWLIGKDGKPVRDAINWLDGRAMEIIEE